MPKLDVARELSVREAAFQWLRNMERSGRTAFTRDELSTEFTFNGQRIPLADRYGRGIHSPAPLHATLSVSSTWREVSSLGYLDVVDDDAGIVTYSYESRAGGTNTKLQLAARESIPVVYFRPIAPRLYAPYYPVKVEDRAADRVFLLHMDDVVLFEQEDGGPGELQRSYIERTMWARVHQPAFRGMVMRAYKERCAVCSLAHPQLLDAAHILSDRHERGLPTVSNGLSLCKIHHSAYDSNMLGISADMQVVIPDRLLAERDGPMLLHGLQEMHGASLRLPGRVADRPNQEHLAERFSAFTAANA